MKKWKRMLLYGGYEREEYLRYKPMIMRSDTKALSAYLIVAGVFFLLLGIASMLSTGFTHINVSIYLHTAAAFLVTRMLLQISIRLKGDQAPINELFIYLFISILYLESIAITVQHRDLPSVTYLGVLLVLPLLFAQSPLRMSLSQCFFVALFCICMRRYKLPEVIALDIWNGITFLFISIVEIMIVTPRRIGQLIQHETIKKLYETDLLTGLRNRNSYELDRKRLEKRTKRPICVYADANGLHELNNRSGHEAGDRMLVSVAEALRASFGEKDTYRIGGDEFVAFDFERDEAYCRTELARILAELEGKGYHVSFGLAAPEGSSDSPEAIIGRAERRMYSAKEEYYRMPGRDRRACRTGR